MYYYLYYYHSKIDIFMNYSVELKQAFSNG